MALRFTVAARRYAGVMHVVLTDTQKAMLGPDQQLAVTMWWDGGELSATLRRLSWFTWGFRAPDLPAGAHQVWFDLDAERYRLSVPGDLESALRLSPAATATFHASPLAFRAAAIRWLGAAVEPDRRAARLGALVQSLDEKTSRDAGAVASE